MQVPGDGEEVGWGAGSVRVVARWGGSLCLAECWWLWFGFAAARAFVAGGLAVSADAKRRGRLVDEPKGWLHEFRY